MELRYLRYFVANRQDAALLSRQELGISQPPLSPANSAAGAKWGPAVPAFNPRGGADEREVVSMRMPARSLAMSDAALEGEAKGRAG